MGMNNHSESLTELVFQRRNRAYGSYQLRKQYLRTLLISVFTGIGLGTLIALIPFILSILQDIQPTDNMDYLYEVEYIPFIPPDDMDLVEQARLYALQPEEKFRVPVVTDTIVPAREKKPPEILPKIAEDQRDDGDTASYGTGGEDIGRQSNTDTTLSTTLDVYPRYPGGVESRLYFLRRHVIYPKEAIDQGIQGVVMVLFVIEKDGSVSTVSVLQGIGGGCDDEAVRVTKNMPKWIPGMRGGYPVRVMVKMPIVFRLPGKSAS